MFMECLFHTQLLGPHAFTEIHIFFKKVTETVIMRLLHSVQKKTIPELQCSHPAWNGLGNTTSETRNAALSVSPAFPVHVGPAFT